MKCCVVLNIVLLFCFILCCNCDKKYRNNVCKSFEDYSTIETNQNCWFNPDVFDELEPMIKRNGYPYEYHEVTSEDGYITNLVRLPKKDPKGIVMLIHAALASGMVWVNMANNSFAFMLWNEGYDVWLTNNRGSVYAKEHVNLTIKDPKFWDFSYHENAIYDTPAQIDYIRNYTDYKYKVACGGQSMGGTIVLIYGALKPQHAKNNTNILIPMAPAARFAHLKSTLLKLFGSVLSTHEIWNQMYRHRVLELLPKYGTISNLRRYFCTRDGIWHFLCAIMDGIIYGVTPNEFTPDLQPIVHSQYPAGTSLKSFAHYSQAIGNKGRFAYFDYGPDKNMELYGTKESPEYPMGNISVPMYMVYGTEDILCSKEDQEDLISTFSEEAKSLGSLPVEGFNHADVLYGRHCVEKVYKPLIKLLNSLSFA